MTGVEEEFDALFGTRTDRFGSFAGLRRGFPEGKTALRTPSPFAKMGGNSPTQLRI